MTHRSSVVDVHPHQLDYRVLVEECLAGIYLIQGDRFLYVNPMLARLFGYAQEELLERFSVLDLVDPGDRDRVETNLRRRQDGDVQTLQYTFRGLRSDGSTFEVEVRGRRTAAGGRAAVIGTLLDVTARSQERDRLRFLARAAELLDSSLDYEATLESLARLMIPFFADLCFIDVIEGDHHRRLVAGPWPGEEGFSLRSTDTPGDEPDVGVELALTRGTGLLLETVPEETAARVAAQLPSRQSRDPLGIHSLIVVPLKARGEIIGAMTLATTVSGRRYERQDLDFSREVARRAALAVDNARLYREAQEAIQRRQEVLAVVSHDLRTPLNIITMSADLALDQDRRQQGPMETVQRAAKDMERLIDDLLDASAIEAGGLSVRPSPHSLSDALRRCIEMVEPAARQRAVQILYETEGVEPPAAMLDERRFGQAVCNLLNNAVKFTPEGGTVRVGTGWNEGFAFVYVRDSGPGIPSDQLDHVFDRFWQLDDGHIGGAGLGLAIVRGIAQAHGGSVSVESTPGQGSTFSIAVPLA
ncbi:MAG: ATP-binding protein [Gemmatimonadota bacterium]